MTKREFVSLFHTIHGIFPFQEQADAVFNSTLVYEHAVLKTYAERFLLQVPIDSPAFVEAERLLRFLSLFVAIYPEEVPPTSLLRELLPVPPEQLRGSDALVFELPVEDIKFEEAGHAHLEQRVVRIDFPRHGEPGGLCLQKLRHQRLTAGERDQFLKLWLQKHAEPRSVERPAFLCLREGGAVERARLIGARPCGRKVKVRLWRMRGLI